MLVRQHPLLNVAVVHPLQLVGHFQIAHEDGVIVDEIILVSR